MDPSPTPDPHHHPGKQFKMSLYFVFWSPLAHNVHKEGISLTSTPATYLYISISWCTEGSLLPPSDNKIQPSSLLKRTGLLSRVPTLLVWRSVWECMEDPVCLLPIREERQRTMPRRPISRSKRGGLLARCFCFFSLVMHSSFFPFKSRKKPARMEKEAKKLEALISFFLSGHWTPSGELTWG